MKICKNCGAQNFDISSSCEKCQQPFENEIMTQSIEPLEKPMTPQFVYNENFRREKPKNNGLHKAAKIFLIIESSILVFFFLLMFLLWIICMIAASRIPDGGTGYANLTTMTALMSMIAIMIPTIFVVWMTISYCGKLNEGERISTAFKICILLFVNHIAGILLLCAEED